MNLKVVLVTFLSMVFLIGTAQAQQEFNASIGNDFTPRDFYNNHYNQYSPKVACQEDYDHCSALIYQHEAGFGRSEKLYYTTDNFEELNLLGFPDTEKETFANTEYPNRDDNASSEGALNISRGKNRGYMPLGYDIWYDDSSEKYYILMSTRSGNGDNDNADCEKYTYSTSQSPNLQGPTSCGQVSNGTGGGGSHENWGGVFGIYDKGSTEPFYVRIHGWCEPSATPTCTSHVIAQAYYVKNDTLKDQYELQTHACVSTTTTDGAYRFYGLAGFFDDDFESQKRDVVFSYGCGNTATGRCSGGAGLYCGGFQSTDMGSFPTAEDGYMYYDSPNLYYIRTDSPSVAGIWRTTTTDFSSYSNTQSYWLWENSTYSEQIVAGSLAKTSYSQWVYERSVNTTADNPRSFSYSAPLLPVNIRSVVSVPINNFIQEEDSIATVEILCPNGYSDTDSGTSFILNTECNNMTVKFDSFNVRPTNSEENIVIPDECSEFSIFYNSLPSKVNITIEVTDQFTGQPVENAVVTVGTESNTTDANGTTVISVNPIINPTYLETDFSCIKEFIATAEPDSLSVRITHPDYFDSNTVEEFVTIKPNGRVKYSLNKPLQITPDGAFLIVSLLTEDNVEIFPPNTFLKAEGADDTWVILERQFNQDTTNVFPAEFLFFDSLDTFDINLTLTYFSQEISYNVSEISDGTGVTKGEFKEVNFPIPLRSQNTTCLTTDDCRQSFCADSTYASLIGCNIDEDETEGKCTYSFTQCTLCDEDIGCYDFVTTDECSDHLDCLNQSTCQSSSRARTGLCGSNDVCLFKDIVCVTPDYCDVETLPDNQTAGLCQQTYLCVLTGGIREIFRIRVATNNAEYLLTGEPWKDAVNVEYGCTVETAGTKTCIDGYTVPEAQAEVGIATFPENWAYNVNSTSGVEFYDVAVECSEGCNITYKYCQFGCVDGDCLTAPLSPEASVRNIFQSLQVWWITMFPTIWEQSFIWTIISLLSSLGIAGAIGFILRGSGTGGGIAGQEIGSIFITSAIGFFLLGVFIGAMPLFVGVLFAIFGGFLVWQLWR